MSERTGPPPGLSTTSSPLSIASGGLAIVGSYLLAAQWGPYYSHPNTSTPNTPTDPQYLYTILAPTTHGSLLVTGTPATAGTTFTQNDIDNTHVLYQNSSGSSDSFTYMLTATPVSGVATPYSITFSQAPPNQNTIGIYWSAMLVGAGEPPTPPNIGDTTLPFDQRSWGNITALGAVSSATHVISLSGDAHTIVLVSVSTNARGSLVPPTSVTIAGLTLTALGSQTTAYSPPDGGATAFGIWMYWAPVPATLTDVAFTVTCSNPGSETVTINGAFAVYHGIANPSAPFDGTPSFSQITSFPYALSMTPSHPDSVILPVVFESKYYLATGVGTYDAPLGYGLWTMQEESGGWAVGVNSAYNWKFSLYNRADYIGVFSIDVTSYAITLTDSELVFSSTVGFVDFTNTANRRLFVSGNTTPQWLGPSGALAFGGAIPPVYLTTLGPPTNFAQNNGSGGSFAVTQPIAGASGPGCTPYYITEAADPAANPEWRLTVSDDGGRTWSTLVKPRSIGALGEYLTRLRWLKMGHSRERMIRLECSDPVRRNVVGFYIDTTQGMG